MAVNATFISLILNCIHPQEAIHFQPIALCNVTYKVFSKVIANNSLKGVLNEIIPNAQGAFLKGRSSQINLFLPQNCFIILGGMIMSVVSAERWQHKLLLDLGR